MHDEREEKALLEVLNSGQWGSHTEKGKVLEFREKFAAYQEKRMEAMIAPKRM